MNDLTKSPERREATSRVRKTFFLVSAAVAFMLSSCKPSSITQGWGQTWYEKVDIDTFDNASGVVTLNKNKWWNIDNMDVKLPPWKYQILIYEIKTSWASKSTSSWYTGVDLITTQEHDSHGDGGKVVSFEWKEYPELGRCILIISGSFEWKQLHQLVEIKNLWEEGAMDIRLY